MRTHPQTHRQHGRPDAVLRNFPHPVEVDVRVQEIMSEAVQTVAPTTEAEDAWNLMRTKRIHHLVVTEGRRIVGVVSDRDLGGRRGTSVRKNQTVRDLMTEAVVTVPPTTPVRKAANLMRGRSIGCWWSPWLDAPLASSPSPTCWS